ncbi:hypothetical protein D9613_001308 [Agrocybe pediades]|uniref:Uncharacterized protein n=1 Tax=Agrocybe pediades TaxID=84607 RepID=A0A8H4R5A2_9AGAR|nr:hypothetical protein D9613_001308 [Agrocybe pediades]
MQSSLVLAVFLAFLTAALGLPTYADTGLSSRHLNYKVDTIAVKREESTDNVKRDSSEEFTPGFINEYGPGRDDVKAREESGEEFTNAFLIEYGSPGHAGKRDESTDDVQGLHRREE